MMACSWQSLAEERELEGRPGKGAAAARNNVQGYHSNGVLLACWPVRQVAGRQTPKTGTSGRSCPKRHRGAACDVRRPRMTKRQPKLTHQEQVDEIVRTLMHDRLPKDERIRLMKDLVARGDDLPDEALAEALKKLLERLLL